MIVPVYVTYDKYEEYVCRSMYNVDAIDTTQAEKKAKQKYSDDFGFDVTHIKTHIVDRYKYGTSSTGSK